MEEQVTTVEYDCEISNKGRMDGEDFISERPFKQILSSVPTNE